jgi:lysophospholipase L1-like esterase
MSVTLLAAACGPYRTEADATSAGVRVVAAFACGAAIRFDDEGPAPPITPTAHFPNGSPTPQPTTTAIPLVDAHNATFEALSTMMAQPQSRTPTTTETCADPTVGGNEDETPEPPTPVLAITATPPSATETAVPTFMPEPTLVSTPEPTGTSAVATASARALRQMVYLSIGDGLQWGCCGALSSSAPALFADHLTGSLGRPVFWQSPGSGYETTDTFINGRDGQQSQLDGALELMAAYPRNEIPLAALTMSIGGNNLVDVGRDCGSPPCAEAFAAGLTHLREQLHAIYGRISVARPPNVPLLVLLYYDADECTDPAGGAAVDAWNAVIAEVATQYGAFLVDARSLFKGHCDWIDANGLDANAAGHAAIAAEYGRVYDALPAEYRQP